MMKTKTKICGITQVEDAIVAAQAGAEFIGLVFYQQSSRHVDIAQAKKIVAALPSSVQPVGLFVDASAECVQHVLTEVPLAILQFHGREPATFCQKFNLPYWKAVRVRSRQDIESAVVEYISAAALLLDTYHPQQVGGTGETFNWNIIPENLNKHFILAGGLNPDNVAIAIAQTYPDIVDVSSGVEQQPGVKSPEKITAFCREVKRSNDSVN